MHRVGFGEIFPYEMEMVENQYFVTLPLLAEVVIKITIVNTSLSSLIIGSP
jgi:hypothetical protein